MSSDFYINYFYYSANVVIDTDDHGLVNTIFTGWYRNLIEFITALGQGTLEEYGSIYVSINNLNRESAVSFQSESAPF